MRETLKSTKSKQKAVLLVQDADTRLNSTYLMLERLKNLKSGVQYYVAGSFKSDQYSIITAKEWQLGNHIILLL